MKEEQLNNAFRAAALIGKYLQGKLSGSDEQELEGWISHSDKNRQLFREMCSAALIQHELDVHWQHDKTAAWARLEGKLGARKIKKPAPAYGRMFMKAAAILLCMLGIWQLSKQFGKHKDTFGTPAAYAMHVMPGGNRAELVLGDGTLVALHGAGDSSFFEGGNKITATAGNILRYEKDGDARAGLFNTLRVPGGAQYTVVLEDGTKVYLNAASSLHYPVHFTGAERRVQLTGEAFFEIAKNKQMPFIVSAGRMDVQAVGTAFNVTSYAQADSTVTATLAEGLVKITALNKTMLLQPGESFFSNPANSGITIADVEAVTAWKNGLFVFSNTPLDKVIEEIERWYDIKVSYAKGFNHHRFFTGEINRQVALGKILNMLELAGMASFAFNNKTVTILPYTNP
jgi:ferric-dicitrate binding protein FerR (iron transport regulator)